MAGQSIWYRILEGVAAAVTAAQVSAEMDIAVRMAGKYFSEPVDVLPVTLIGHGDPDSTEYASFEDHRRKTFTVYIATLVANNQDYDSKFDTYLLWRERIENAIDPPGADNPILPGLEDHIESVQVLPQSVLDERLAGRGYAFTGMAVRYTVVVERT